MLSACLPRKPWQALLALALALPLVAHLPGTALADGDKTVRVAKGDTLSSISVAQYGDASHVQAIADYNHLPSNDKITAGQSLRLPSKSVTVARTPPAEQTGVATWYGPGFEGKTTKCGQTYAQAGMSTASNDYPCGAIVEVTNLANGHRVTVPVTDTGAFRHPNVLDLSRGAFSTLSETKIGVIPVRVLLRSLAAAAPSAKGSLPAH
jgi:rare lipoprotein A (peptidoglycan hydrolase)